MDINDNYKSGNNDELASAQESTKSLSSSSTPTPRRKLSISSSGSEVDPLTSFVDVLLDKMRRKNFDSSVAEVSKVQRLLSESDDDLLVEVEAPVSFNKPSNPNLLATPIVNNQRNNSVFVSSEEEYQRMVAKHKAKAKANQFQLTDSSQMGSKSQPPQMQAPELPANVSKPRTLADKRLLMSNINNNNGIKFLMVEQENKMYRQVQRKKTNMEINYQMLDTMIIEDIPINRGPWKVLTWLRTREENYFQNYINLDGVDYKLNGSRGNHRLKYLKSQSSRPFPKQQVVNVRTIRCCPGSRVRKRIIDAVISSDSMRRFVLQENVSSQKRLDTKYLDNQLVSITPRPLGKKIELINQSRKLLQNDEDSAFLGDYAKFEMPEVKLQVDVVPTVSLDPVVKKYLKEILPHRRMSEKWCEFALTALDSKTADDESSRSFDFTIPYQNDKKAILVREIIRSKEDNEPLRIIYDESEDLDDDMEWTFAKDVDKDDLEECEIVDIIKDLTNSVFINLNDDLFSQDDPHDRKTSSLISPVKSKEALEELSTLQRNKSSKVLKELIRLNANVYMSESCVEDENDMRRHATAHLGKEERELRPTVIVTESDTVLLGTREKESRRIKRIPKKFDDYLNPVGKGNELSDFDEPATKKAKLAAAKAKIDQSNDESYKARQARFASTNQSSDELKIIKDEVNKMLHVRVQLRRLQQLNYFEPWCMIHQLYKCQCKGTVVSDKVFTLKPPSDVTKKDSIVKPLLSDAAKQAQLMFRRNVQKSALINDTQPLLVNATRPLQNGSSPMETDDLPDDGAARRVLPLSKTYQANKGPLSNALINGAVGDKKIEVTNLADLINGRVGPIFINVYDDRTMRLNPILRSVLNNRSAIIYCDGSGYFVDKKRVDVRKLDFSPMADDVENPIFIIQAKDDFPPPVSSTMNDDFIKFVFKKDSSSVMPITDKKSLNEVGQIIESILRNIRKKIEMQLGNDRSELVKEQLSMITRDRSRSNSMTSISSTNSSPLSFQGQRLTEAPPPGLDTPLMMEFNKIFSSRMQRLVQQLNNNILGLRPSNEMLNKLCIYQWSLLLKSYEEDLVQIWQVSLDGKFGAKYHVLVLTDSREKPDVEFARKEFIVNIRSLSLSDNITELTRLILLRVENATTKNMTILMYGCKGYLRMVGMLNSNEAYQNGFVAKPTRSTHPRIAAKIQKIYHIWHASKRQQIARKKQSLMSHHQKQLKIKFGREGETTSKEEIVKKSTQSELKWFMFNITNDFSDIYIKNWKRYLSYRVIMEAIQQAKEKNRAVPMVANDCEDDDPQVASLKRWPRIYALPTAPLKFKEHDSMTENFLIFGPYKRLANSNLLLMQNVDGELILRDEYEKTNNITRSTRTRCLWIYANTLKCIGDADPDPMRLFWDNNVVEIIRNMSEHPKDTVEPEVNDAIDELPKEDRLEDLKFPSEF